MGTTVTVCSVKGGVGKTVSAFFLAAAAARSGGRVVAVDADPQLSLVEWVADIEEPEFDVVPLMGRRYREAIERAGSGYDVTIVDTPPSSADLAVVSAALAASDVAVVPIGPERVEVSRLVKTVELAQALGVAAAALVTRTDSRWTDHRDLLASLQGDPDVFLLEAYIPRLRAISQSFGRPAPDYLWGYQEAWDEIAAALGAARRGGRDGG